MTVETITLALQPGDRVQLPLRGLVRTVKSVTDSGTVNFADETLYNVNYQEGRTAEWSAGNSAHGQHTWRVVQPTEQQGAPE